MAVFVCEREYLRHIHRFGFIEHYRGSAISLIKRKSLAIYHRKFLLKDHNATRLKRGAPPSEGLATRPAKLLLRGNTKALSLLFAGDLGLIGQRNSRQFRRIEFIIVSGKFRVLVKPRPHVAQGDAKLKALLRFLSFNRPKIFRPRRLIRRCRRK